MRHAFIFSSKVWLTCFFLAPLLFMILTSITTNADTLGLLVWYPGVVLGGLIRCTIISTILLIGAYYISQRKLRSKTFKLYLTGLGMVATIFSFYLVSGMNGEEKEVELAAISYSVIVVLSIWLNKLKSVDEKALNNPAA